jgi:hypothetical protein
MNATVRAGFNYTKPALCFDYLQMQIVCSARKRAQSLVSDYYRVSPREWQRMPYEVKTLRALRSSEVTNQGLAQTVCYEFTKQAGQHILSHGDLYRICLQDDRILHVADAVDLKLAPLLTYVLTHELIHVVRFGQRLQAMDLPDPLRQDEELKVHKTTKSILAAASDNELDRVLSSDLANVI